ncbi:MAG: TetR/AcrR family transcriptional regulator [Mycobacterium sp.]
MARMAQVRPYRGIDAVERVAGRRRRLLDAGLDLLGAAGKDPAELTVRAICGQATLGVRYFYESFTDKDHFVGAVFDSVIADIAATTQAAVASAAPGEQARAAMANVVRAISADTRVGRLLFSVELSNTEIVRKRAESSALFAALLFAHAGAQGALDNDHVKAASHFAVGGVGQTISAWLSGEVRLDHDELVNLLAALIDQLAAMPPRP